jgi:hypothetical protein
MHVGAGNSGGSRGEPALVFVMRWNSYRVELKAPQMPPLTAQVCKKTRRHTMERTPFGYGARACDFEA